MVDEDLEQLRRSLAMAPRLPPEQINRLLAEVQSLRSRHRHLLEALDQVVRLLEEARARAQ